MSEHWTEKYRPKSLSEIVGNESAIQGMRRWAESWAKGRPSSKAIVLRGDPGIGKTSAAIALANDFGWDVVEMNASDHRNAASIRRIAGVGAISQTFTAKGEFLSAAEGRRKLIILDEADNLFGREDHGGAKAIVETIRGTSQPIVLIVNDYYQLSRRASGVKTLARSVYFKKLAMDAVVSLLGSVALRENLQAEKEVLERIAENSNGDLRAALNDLQMLFEGRSKLVGDETAPLGKRDQDLELGEALNALFDAKTVKDAVRATFDLDKTPDELEKWIEESIPAEFRDHGDMASAFDALSRADIYLRWTRLLQHYGLWAYARELMTGGVSLARSGGTRAPRHEFRFPSHFIVMSRASAQRTARSSVARKFAAHTHTSKRCVNDSTLPLLLPLLRRDEELLGSLVSTAGLDEDDLSYLLGDESSSEKVRRIMERARSPGPGAEDASAEAKMDRQAGARRKSLGDF